MTELENALNSTTRGMQVDEVALSIWSTQTYKRYVRAKMTDSPPGRVDRLFVPPFGLEGIPRLLIVLAKHRKDDNHWVVHR